MTNRQRITRSHETPTEADSIAAANMTLGVLAGGQASRLGGIDKAWLVRAGAPQVIHVARRFGSHAADTIVSANRNQARYAAAGLRTVSDAQTDIGPLAALDALAQASATPWLLTVPVDIVDTHDRIVPSLLAACQAGGRGVFAEDDEGVQPLVALWPVNALRGAVTDAITSGDHAIRSLQARLGMHSVRLAGLRLGNLNTPADLAAAGIETS